MHASRTFQRVAGLLCAAAATAVLIGSQLGMAGLYSTRADTEIAARRDAAAQARARQAAAREMANAQPAPQPDARVEPSPL